MITAIDTSVLLDVFGADPRFGPRSGAALKQALSEGAAVACDVVWSEVSAGFGDAAKAAEAMEKLRIDFSAIHLEAALAAGSAWRNRRRRGGARQRVISDFLIGAHASWQADRLLTRDRGFYRSYFRDLALLDPTSP